MNKQQWSQFESVINKTNERLYSGLIVDSPWIPGYCGMTNLDFYARPDEWLRAYSKIKADFPELIFLPDWWCEYGMATEPSGFGCKVGFYDDNLPVVHHILENVDDENINSLTAPNPRVDGLMPLLLNVQRYVQPRIQEMGEDIYIVATRGPLTIASHLMEMTEFLVGIKTVGNPIHKILRKTTNLCKNWLDAQLNNVKNAKGILVLDDVTGFLNEEDYLEFSHPYLKEIFSAFPDMLHLLHNDAVSTSSYPYLADMGVDLFNMTHTVSIAKVKKLVGDRVCLLGNIPPMSLTNQTPEDVSLLTNNMIDEYISANCGDFHGLLVSTGGGAPMGSKGENIRALIDAVSGYHN